MFNNLCGHQKPYYTRRVTGVDMQLSFVVECVSLSDRWQNRVVTWGINEIETPDYLMNLNLKKHIWSYGGHQNIITNMCEGFKYVNMEV